MLISIQTIITIYILFQMFVQQGGNIQNKANPQQQQLNSRRTREIQQNAIEEILTESKNLFSNEDIRQIANQIEEQAFIVCHGENTKDYRSKVTSIKMRLKGDRGKLLRDSLLSKKITAEELLAMDINKLQQEQIQQYLVSMGKFTEEVQSEKSKLPQTRSKIPSPLPIKPVLRQQHQMVPEVVFEQSENIEQKNATDIFCFNQEALDAIQEDVEYKEQVLYQEEDQQREEERPINNGEEVEEQLDQNNENEKEKEKEEQKRQMHQQYEKEEEFKDQQQFDQQIQEYRDQQEYQQDQDQKYQQEQDYQYQQYYQYQQNQEQEQEQEQYQEQGQDQEQNEEQGQDQDQEKDKLKQIIESSFHPDEQVQCEQSPQVEMNFLDKDQIPEQDNHNNSQSDDLFENGSANDYTGEINDAKCNGDFAEQDSNILLMQKQMNQRKFNESQSMLPEENPINQKFVEGDPFEDQSLSISKDILNYSLKQHDNFDNSLSKSHEFHLNFSELQYMKKKELQYNNDRSMQNLEEKNYLLEAENKKLKEHIKNLESHYSEQIAQLNKQMEMEKETWMNERQILLSQIGKQKNKPQENYLEEIKVELNQLYQIIESRFKDEKEGKQGNFKDNLTQFKGLLSKLPIEEQIQEENDSQENEQDQVAKQDPSFSPPRELPIILSTQKEETPVQVMKDQPPLFVNVKNEQTPVQVVRGREHIVQQQVNQQEQPQAEIKNQQQMNIYKQQQVKHEELQQVKTQESQQVKVQQKHVQQQPQPVVIQKQNLPVQTMRAKAPQVQPPRQQFNRQNIPKSLFD